MSQHQLPQYPTLLPQVLLDCSGPTLALRYRDRGCTFSVNSDQYEATTHFLKLLQTGGHSIATLQTECAAIADDIPLLLKSCFQRQLLMESSPVPSVSGLTGREFYPILKLYLTQQHHALPNTLMGQRMQDHTITRNELIGYVLESYHITYLCPQLLAPALAQANQPSLRNLIQSFFISELNHDQLVERSLNSIGIKPAQLKTMLPLPMTLAACALLSQFAHDHFPSFMAALMLFEQPNPDFHHRFEAECQRLNLPASFYHPILVHAGINDEGHHEDVAEPMFATVPWISLAEQEQVKRNMHLLLDTFVLRTQEIVDYYGAPTAIIPRYFGDRPPGFSPL